MSFYKFKDSDKLINYVKTYPQSRFFVYDSKIYYDNKPQISGAFTTNITCVPSGYISLDEMNIDRNSGSTGFIYPYVVKDGTLSSFRTTSTSEFDSEFDYGDIITGSYPISSSLYREYFQVGQARPHISALQNTLNYYSHISKHYEYSSSYGNKSNQQICLISIPSIFYSSQIKKKSIKLDFYVTGTLIGTLEDKNANGELIQTAPYGSNGSGSVAGIVLYKEGFICLTGSWGLESGVARNYLNDSINLVTSSWVHFGNGLNGNVITDAGQLSDVSYQIYFEGVNTIPVLTLFSHAPRAELNHSNNPTYIKYNTSSSYSTSSNSYIENNLLEVKNTVLSSYPDPTGSFQKQTFISKVGIYDENKNLIGIAKLAKPVKKTEERDLTFKLKIDL
jgi:hypothetical protein